MAWKKLLLILFALVPIIQVFVPESGAFAAQTCSAIAVTTGTCTGAQTSSNSVNVWGRITSSGGVSEVSAPTQRVTSVPRTGQKAPYYPTGEMTFNCVFRLATIASCVPKPSTPAPAPQPVYVAPVTLEDLASFSPEQVSLSSQPSGWTVLGVSTNFIATTSQHVVSGSLFGQSAEVRFTPVGFDWDYGDGGSRSTAQGGASWQALGLVEFSQTETSHVYQSVGTFTTSVRARYSVEYRIGAGNWIVVSGEVSSSAVTSVLLVQKADTVLAARDCRQPGVQESCPS